MTTFKTISCPQCGTFIKQYANPVPTVDTIIEFQNGIVLIDRKNPPFGWAIPGGFVDYGESVEAAAIREAREETGLILRLKGILGVYSAPDRDPRQHTISTVFIAEAEGQLRAGDDARAAKVFNPNDIPEKLVFDHGTIMDDYMSYLKGLRSLCPAKLS